MDLEDKVLDLSNDDGNINLTRMRSYMKKAEPKNIVVELDLSIKKGL
jgi:hypothetical protein